MALIEGLLRRVLNLIDCLRKKLSNHLVAVCAKLIESQLISSGALSQTILGQLPSEVPNVVTLY